MTDLERTKLENLIGKEVTLAQLKDTPNEIWLAVKWSTKREPYKMVDSRGIKGMFYGFDESVEDLKQRLSNQDINTEELTYTKMYPITPWLEKMTGHTANDFKV